MQNMLDIVKNYIVSQSGTIILKRMVNKLKNVFPFGHLVLSELQPVVSTLLECLAQNPSGVFIKPFRHFIPSNLEPSIEWRFDSSATTGGFPRDKHSLCRDFCL